MRSNQSRPVETEEVTVVSPRNTASDEAIELTRNHKHKNSNLSIAGNFGNVSNAWQSKLKMKLHQHKESKYKNIKPLIKSTVKPIHDRNKSKQTQSIGTNTNFTNEKHLIANISIN